MSEIHSSTGAPPCAPPDFKPRKPDFRFPRNACDCHAHVLGPASRYAYSPARVYTPHDCVLSDYRHMLDTLGVVRPPVQKVLDRLTNVPVDIEPTFTTARTLTTK